MPILCTKVNVGGNIEYKVEYSLISLSLTISYFSPVKMGMTKIVQITS